MKVHLSYQAVMRMLIVLMAKLGVSLLAKLVLKHVVVYVALEVMHVIALRAKVRKESSICVVS